MNIVLPLEKMTVDEKLKLMEEIWADLSRNPDDIPVPQWHLDLLREREQLVQEGKADFVDLDPAKKDVAAMIAQDAALRKHFHGEIDRLPPSRLAVLQRVLLQLRLLDATEQLDRDFDADAAAGTFSPERIARAVLEARTASR